MPKQIKSVTNPQKFAGLSPPCPGEMKPESVKEGRKFWCSGCGNIFSYAKTLKKHINRGICGKGGVKFSITSQGGQIKESVLEEGSLSSDVLCKGEEAAEIEISKNRGPWV